jgi:uncharacterized protein (TIGR01244 family)
MRQSRIRSWFRTGAFSIFAAILGLGGYLGYLQLSGNFHTVIEGELYRSAQPDAADIETYAKTYGIRTIVNLRGASEKAGWYAEEVSAAKRLGLTHLNFRMSASKQLNDAQVKQLVALMKDAPKPILIHCRSGADRTGLAAGLYSSQIAGTSEEIAERQLSLYFGHVGIPVISSAYAMDRTWESFDHLSSRERIASNALVTGSPDILQYDVDL